MACICLLPQKFTVFAGLEIKGNKLKLKRGNWGKHGENRSRKNKLVFKEGYCEGKWIACWRPCRARCLGIVERKSQQWRVGFTNPLLSPALHCASKESHPASPHILLEMKELSPPSVHTARQQHTCYIFTSQPHLSKKCTATHTCFF